MIKRPNYMPHRAYSRREYRFAVRQAQSARIHEFIDRNAVRIFWAVLAGSAILAAIGLALTDPVPGIG